MFLCSRDEMNVIDVHESRNTCILELAKLTGEAHKMSGMHGRGKRIGVNCVAWEGGFQHWL